MRRKTIQNAADMKRMTLQEATDRFIKHCKVMDLREQTTARFAEAGNAWESIDFPRRSL